MAFGFGKKSAGVRVSGAAHRLIGRGNHARDARLWAEAAQAYRSALAEDPSLYHIWLQLGHAAKEAGAGDEARAAYEEAARLRPGDREPGLLLAHLAKGDEDRLAAGRRFAAMAANGDHVEEAARELSQIVSPVFALSPAQIAAVYGERPAARLAPPASAEAVARLEAELGRVADLLVDDPRAAALAEGREKLAELARTAPEPITPLPRPMVFDIADLIGHFRFHRLPTGIQRVQIEVLAGALKARGSEGIEICCIFNGREEWVGIPADRFLHVAYLASAGNDADDPEWQAARTELFLHILIDEPYELPDDAILVNLGTSWWIYDYFRMVREAKAAKRIAYVAMVYDLIPVLQPQYCVDGITRDYISWAVGVFGHADGFLAISESTKRDLIGVARRLGHALPPEKVEVIPLDADFRRTTAPLPDEALAQWGLANGGYALFVSTIEARKNHVLAFETWGELIRRHGRSALPRLVCVGRNGWLNDQAFALLAADAELRAHVTIIDRASDEELALLYRCCRFTVYPSHYEGWGLPVTESLSYGRVPVVADNSSLPEAGGRFALMFEDDSVDACVVAVERVAFDDAWREAREAEIAVGFAPRRWTAVATQTVDAVLRLAAASPSAPVSRAVVPGQWYPTTLYYGARIWQGLASGELFRAGEGWLWPETGGCRTTPAGGELRMTVAGDGGPLRLYLLVQGPDKVDCPYRLEAAGALLLHGQLAPGERRWLLADLPPGPDIALTIAGGASETIQMKTGGIVQTHEASLAVLGFAVCPRDDEAARLAFVEASAFGEIGDISAYRERATELTLT